MTHKKEGGNNDSGTGCAGARENTGKSSMSCGWSGGMLRLTHAGGVWSRAEIRNRFPRAETEATDSSGKGVIVQGLIPCPHWPLGREAVVSLGEDSRETTAQG